MTKLNLYKYGGKRFYRIEAIKPVSGISVLRIYISTTKPLWLIKKFINEIDKLFEKFFL